MSTTATVLQKVKPMNTIQAVNLALDEAMGLDPNVILLGEDIADGQEGGIVGVTKGLSTKYGASRVRSTPIAEQAIMGAAIGAAIVGMRPVAEIEGEIEARIDAAVAFALSSPLPQPDDLRHDVFAEEILA